MSVPLSPIVCDLKGITPEDFFRKVVRTNGTGGFALAVKDVAAFGTWAEAAECADGITWQDILQLVTGLTADNKWAINIVKQS